MAKKGMIMKTNHFITGDAVEDLKKLPDASIDLICTDPPYNLGKDYGNNLLIFLTFLLFFPLPAYP